MRTMSILVVMCFAVAAHAEDAPLRLAQSIPLPDSRGRIDHLTLDANRQRLFVAELGNDSIAVVDLAAGKLTGRLTGIAEPQGVVYVPESDRLFVTSAGTGAVAIFSGGDLRSAGQIDLGADADNIRYDPASGEVYVGYGDGALGILSAASGEPLGKIPLAAHPESFQLETAGARIFVNVPGAGQIAVVDRRRRAPLAVWPLAGVSANFPMALDEAGHRVIVIARAPPTLLLIDAESGKEITRVDSCGDGDDGSTMLRAGSSTYPVARAFSRSLRCALTPSNGSLGFRPLPARAPHCSYPIRSAFTWFRIAASNRPRY
jgi:DNA-binding beta-propeller fold protein YncE